MYYASYVTSDGIEAGAGWFPTAAEASRFLAHITASGKEIRDPQVIPVPGAHQAPRPEPSEAPGREGVLASASPQSL